jgi:deoxyadenosine/deoxycytidine kinase
MADMVILLSGNVATGKSTLIRRLSPLLGALKTVDNPYERAYRELFVDNPGTWAFHNQLDFMTHRFVNLADARKSNKIYLVEGNPYISHEVWTTFFASRGFIGKREQELLQSVYNLYSEFVPRPDLLLHLSANVSTLVERFRLRDRPPNDTSFGLNSYDFISHIGFLIENWEKGWTASPKIVIDSETSKFRDDDEACRLISDRIRNVAGW